jgi:transcriptional regulator with XRE-family HTH domain
MSTLNERFGINLMELRKKSRISQMELAEKSKLDLKTISNLENGIRQPVLKTIWKLANGLNVSMSKLLDF